MPVETLIFLYVILLLAGIGGLALLNEIRRRGFETGRTSDRVFRCEKCGFMYTDDPGVDRSRCPQCGITNTAFEF